MINVSLTTIVSKGKQSSLKCRHMISCKNDPWTNHPCSSTTSTLQLKYNPQSDPIPRPLVMLTNTHMHSPLMLPSLISLSLLRPFTFLCYPLYTSSHALGPKCMALASLQANVRRKEDFKMTAYVNI